MDCAFDNLDAAGFLEIWQHFDADGKKLIVFFLHKYTWDGIELFNDYSSY